MTGSEFEVSRLTGHCAITGRKFAEGETYYAALFEGPGGLERRDYALDAWTGPPEGCTCYWRARVPTREKKPNIIQVDLPLLYQLFLRLEEQEHEQIVAFRFVLGLLLMRKKLLRFDRSVREGGQEYWEMRSVEDGSQHRLLNPRLTAQQVERLEVQLRTLLSGDVEALEWVQSPESIAAEPVTPQPAADAEAAASPEAPADQASADAAPDAPDATAAAGAEIAGDEASPDAPNPEPDADTSAERGNS